MRFCKDCKHASDEHGEWMCYHPVHNRPPNPVTGEVWGGQDCETARQRGFWFRPVPCGPKGNLWEQGIPKHRDPSQPLGIDPFSGGSGGGGTVVIAVESKYNTK